MNTVILQHVCYRRVPQCWCGHCCADTDTLSHRSPAPLSLPVGVLHYCIAGILQAIDALSLCDVDGRMFLEMDEEDLAESEELGLDVSAERAVSVVSKRFSVMDRTVFGQSGNASDRVEMPQTEFSLASRAARLPHRCRLLSKMTATDVSHWPSKD